MSQHTPGPWRVHPAVCTKDHPDTSADVRGPHGEFVANCGCNEKAIANARLIAAAPALYEALSNLADMYDLSLDTWEVVRAALALATGKDGAE